MENIYIPGHGTFTLNFNVEDFIPNDDQIIGEPLEYEHKEFLQECKKESINGVPGTNTGKKFSKDHKRRISESLKGKKIGPMSEEHKKKISDALKGRVLAKSKPVISKEERLRRSERAKKWWTSNKGKINRRSTKIVVDDKVINSIKEAAELYKVSRQTVYSRIYSDKFNWHFF